MPVNDELGKRMKTYYEQIPKSKLMRRTPVIIGIDGKAFHTFTKGMNRPFDDILIKTMQETTKYLCENIQGCVLGYTQSDEISLVLIDYHKLTTNAWFDYEVQKMCSVAASMATMAFNRFFNNIVESEYKVRKELCKNNTGNSEKANAMFDVYLKKINCAMFDARCFNIPKEEVANYIYWRQLDATRNSIQMVGQANFSHKELHNKSCNMIQDMLMTQKEINWNGLPIYKKRGTCVTKHNRVTGIMTDNPQNITRWEIDTKIPVFKGEDREYVEKLIYIGE